MTMADGVEEGRATLCVIMACVLATCAVGCVLTVRGCVDNGGRGFGRVEQQEAAR